MSKFVIEVVESTLAENTEFKPRGEMVKEMGQLRSENKTLKDELKLKNIVLDKYEGELKRYRSEAFLEDKFDGVRKYNKELVAILKNGGVMDSYKLLGELGIDPGEAELVKAISRQLEGLEGFGLISSTQRGWKWVG
ncbi:MAG: hypothetical protein GKC10_00380 [Methanosarcinales archaeon]|nr:hypothetical protein [Methanosarcinales archaeon]